MMKAYTVYEYWSEVIFFLLLDSSINGDFVSSTWLLVLTTIELDTFFYYIVEAKPYHHLANSEMILLCTNNVKSTSYNCSSTI